MGTPALRVKAQVGKIKTEYGSTSVPNAKVPGRGENSPLRSISPIGWLMNRVFKTPKLVLYAYKSNEKNIRTDSSKSNQGKNKNNWYYRNRLLWQKSFCSKSF